MERGVGDPKAAAATRAEDWCCGERRRRRARVRRLFIERGSLDPTARKRGSEWRTVRTGGFAREGTARSGGPARSDQVGSAGSVRCAVVRVGRGDPRRCLVEAHASKQIVLLSLVRMEFINHSYQDLLPSEFLLLY